MSGVTSQFIVEEAMVESNAVRDTVMIWMRRFAFYFLGATGATGALLLLFGSLLYASGVLEW
jgi:hypothetical protein